MRFFPKDRTSLTSAGVADKWNYLEALWVDRRNELSATDFFRMAMAGRKLVKDFPNYE
jgi:hypothetical protein